MKRGVHVSEERYSKSSIEKKSEKINNNDDRRTTARSSGKTRSMPLVSAPYESKRLANFQSAAKMPLFLGTPSSLASSSWIVV